MRMLMVFVFMLLRVELLKTFFSTGLTSAEVYRAATDVLLHVRGIVQDLL